MREGIVCERVFKRVCWRFAMCERGYCMREGILEGVLNVLCRMY